MYLFSFRLYPLSQGLVELTGLAPTLDDHDVHETMDVTVVPMLLVLHRKSKATFSLAAVNTGPGGEYHAEMPDPVNGGQLLRSTSFTLEDIPE
eukprot:1068189-Prorocentrum_minimum.AAC.1